METRDDGQAGDRVAEWGIKLESLNATMSSKFWETGGYCVFCILSSSKVLRLFKNKNMFVGIRIQIFFIYVKENRLINSSKCIYTSCF